MNPHKASRVNKGPGADDRFTPRYLIEALHEEFRFNADAAGNKQAPSARVIGGCWDPRDGVDGLALPWIGCRVFCNPPFSNIPSWVEKATYENRAGCPLIVMLLPWNRQEQPWWQKEIEPYRDSQKMPNITTIALGGGQYGVKGRVKYGTPADPEGKRPKNSPNFSSGLVIWRGNP